jgi:hypothetical protein
VRIRYRLVNDLQYFLLADILFDQCYCGPKFNHIAGKLRHVDHLGTGELVFQFGDPGFVNFLFRPSGLIFRILGKIGIVSNRFLNPLNETRSLHLSAML